MKLNTTVGLLFLLMARVVSAEQTQLQAPFIVGYTHQTSYQPGETIDFHLSTSAKTVSATIQRIGAQDTTVWNKTDIPGRAHAIPDQASSDGCNWPQTFQLVIPADWKSGYYQVNFKENDGDATGSLFFIVRAKHPGKNTKILLQLSTNTYNAYTNWGGHSLYSYHDRDGLQGHRVSFDRPLLSMFSNWEIHFVRWAEANGYQLERPRYVDRETFTRMFVDERQHPKRSTIAGAISNEVVAPNMIFMRCT